MDYKVVLSSSSRKDLQDIVRYISLDEPSRALGFGRFLIHHTKSLSQFPERGRVVPELDMTHLGKSSLGIIELSTE